MNERQLAAISENIDFQIPKICIPRHMVDGFLKTLKWRDFGGRVFLKNYEF